MKINKKCVSCKLCIPYCPMAAIRCSHENNFVYVDQDECVECGVCLRSKICPVDAIYQPQLVWPRVLRLMWSSVTYVHPETQDPGRGTEEMKTNDVTGRFRFGEVGFGIELGRPGIGARFEDAEKVTTALIKHDVTFEPHNPLTKYLNTKTGRFLESYNGYPLDEAFRKTKVMTFIIEFKTKQEATADVVKTIKEVAKVIDTVMSVDLISKCTEDGRIPAVSILDENRIKYYPNCKTCIGLGKPLFVQSSQESIRSIRKGPCVMGRK